MTSPATAGDRREGIGRTETVHAAGAPEGGIRAEQRSSKPREEPVAAEAGVPDAVEAGAPAGSTGGEVKPIDEVDTVPAGGRLEGNIDKETSIEFRREGMRSWLAYVLGAILIGIVAVGAVGWLFFSRPLQEWVTFTAPILTMIATVSGFYFRDRQVEPQGQGQ